MPIFCQDEYKYILTYNRQRGKDGGVAIMCREKTTMQTFRETNITKLQILTVKTTFSGQTMFITVVSKAPKLRDLTFQDELMTHLMETGNHSTANHVVSDCPHFAIHDCPHFAIWAHITII